MVRPVSSRSFLSNQRLKHQKLKGSRFLTKKKGSQKIFKRKKSPFVFYFGVFFLIDNMFWFYFIGGLLYCCVFWLHCGESVDRRPCVLSTQPTVPSFLPAPPVTYGWPQVESRETGWPADLDRFVSGWWEQKHGDLGDSSFHKCEF